MADAEEQLSSMAYESFQTETKGRGLRALKPFLPGDKILDELPAVFVLCNSVRGQRCDFCFRLRAGDELSRCSRCKFARYCGVSCQRGAWNEHKNECNRLKHVFPRVPTDLVRLMYRMLQAKTAMQKNMSWYNSLVSNVSSIEEDRKEAFSPVMVVLSEYSGKELIQQFTTAETFELFGKVSCNSFSICDGEMQPIGVGIFLAAALLNHSCSPNCIAIFNRTQLVIHAVSKISTWDELTISYTELLAPSNVRRKELWSQYCFDCCCPRCLHAQKEDEAMLSIKCRHLECSGAVLGQQGKCNQCGRILESDHSTEFCNKLQEVIKEMKCMQKFGDLQDILDLCEKTLDDYNDYLHPHNYLVVDILNKAMDACVALEMWNKALEFGLRTVEPYLRFYPVYHPSVGIQLFRIGKLEVFLGNLVSGVKSLQRANIILEITHGLIHPLLKDLRELLAQASEELKAEQ